MKPVRIDADAIATVVAALHDVNGAAKSHTANADDVLALADWGEQRLAALQIPQRDRRGAVVGYTPSDRLPNSYARKGFSVIRTSLLIERRATGWYLTSASKISDYPKAVNRRSLSLTAAQDAIAISKLRAGYSVQSVAELVAQAA